MTSLYDKINVQEGLDEAAFKFWRASNQFMQETAAQDWWDNRMPADQKQEWRQLALDVLAPFAQSVAKQAYDLGVQDEIALLNANDLEIAADDDLLTVSNPFEE